MNEKRRRVIGKEGVGVKKTLRGYGMGETEPEMIIDVAYQIGKEGDDGGR